MITKLAAPASHREKTKTTPNEVEKIRKKVCRINTLVPEVQPSPTIDG